MGNSHSHGVTSGSGLYTNNKPVGPGAENGGLITASPTSFGQQVSSMFLLIILIIITVGILG